MSEMWITILYDGQEVTLTMVQLFMFSALVEDIEIEHWHLCDNGCCVLVHERGLDETAWRVSRDGTVEKIDRYGNVLQTLSTPD